MKFRYRAYKKQDDLNAGYGKMPLLQVQLKRGKKTIDLDCLVDSGAGDCLFNSDIAEVLGIDLTKAQPRKYEGIGGIVIPGHICSVMLKVKGFAEWTTIEAGFIAENEMPLLGQSGFFENYEVTFRSYRNQFEVKKKVR